MNEKIDTSIFRAYDMRGVYPKEINEQTEIKKYVNKQPTCVELKYEKNKIFVKVNRIYSIDIVGETKLTISVNEEVKKDDISNINPNYISDKKNS